MNKGELIKAMSEKASISKKSTENSLNAFIEIVSEELKNGENVQLIGFGTFEKRSRAARTGRNPQTGKPIEIPASMTPAFKPGKALKEMINN